MRITVSLPDEVAAQARVEAAREGKSLSRWLAERVLSWKRRRRSGAPRRAAARHAQQRTR